MKQAVSVVPFILLILLALAWSRDEAQAHGSVTAEEDLCVIEIGYFRAHFKIYLPRKRRHMEFCEDIPQTGETVFVMEYEYGDLGNVPLEFRIIEDVTGMGRFANLEDIRRMDEQTLEEATIYHRPSRVQPDVYTVVHDFERSGDYLGIVRARNPDNGQVYAAVFPFRVGFTGFGYWPLFIALIAGIQLTWWWMTGRLGRWLGRFSGSGEKGA